MFKICLDYWNFFVPDVYSSASIDPGATFSFGIAGAGSLGGGAGALAAGGGGAGRKASYAGVLSALRALMIARMAKPEEVIVVEDENGNIVRETMKDTGEARRRAAAGAGGRAGQGWGWRQGQGQGGAPEGRGLPPWIPISSWLPFS